MDRVQAARVLGVGPDTPWSEVRRAYRDHIRAHHPDRAGDTGIPDALRVIEAFRVLERAHHQPPVPPAPDPAPGAAQPVGPPVGRPTPAEGPPVVLTRVDDDTIALGAPADEAFGWLLDAAHDIGEITYLDRSVPIFEVLCRFVGEPATSLVVTLQGRAEVTDAFCTAESIEARPGPPVHAVVDVFEDALRQRLEPYLP